MSPKADILISGRTYTQSPDICCPPPPLLVPCHRAPYPRTPSLHSSPEASSPAETHLQEHGSHGHHRLQPPQDLVRRRPAPVGHHLRPVLRRRHPARRRRRHLQLHLLLHPSLRPQRLQVQPHQGVHRLPRDDPPLHDRHDHLRRHRRRHRRGRLRGAVLRLRALQGPLHQHRHHRAVRLPRRRRLARRPALLRHGRAQARAPLPRRARHRVRRDGGLRRHQARRALHLHRHEPPPRAPQRQALQRRRRRGPHRQGQPGRRRRHQLGASLHEPRHAVLHGPQRHGGQGRGELLRPRRALRRHRGQTAPGHRNDRDRARDEGARHEHGRGRHRAPHPRGRPRHDRHRHGGRRDRRRPENGPNVRRHDDLRPEGGAPGAEGARPAKRHRRDAQERDSGAAPGDDPGGCEQRRHRGRLNNGSRGSHASWCLGPHSIRRFDETEDKYSVDEETTWTSFVICRLVYV